jgi:hypothetical protein
MCVLIITTFKNINSSIPVFARENQTKLLSFKLCSFCTNY